MTTAAGTPLLAVSHLGVRFGGVLAVDDVSFEVRRGEVFTLIGPNGAGKTTVFNLISRLYTPSAGSIEFDGQPLLARAAHEIAGLGIARTFQNIELFENATVLQNLLIGRHTHRRTGFVSDLVFTSKARAAEVEAREAVERVVDLLDLQHHRESLAGLRGRARVQYVLSRLKPFADLVRHRDPFRGVRAEIRRHAVIRANLLAFQRYRLQPYAGSVMLFYAEGRPLIGDLDGRLRWHKLAAGLETYGMPAADSGHLLREPHVRVLAAQLAVSMRRVPPVPGA